MKKVIIGLSLLSLVCGCAHKDSTQTASSSPAVDGTASASPQASPSPANGTNTTEKAGKIGAKALIMAVAGKPLKVASAVGTAAGVVKKKVEGDSSPTPTPQN